MRTRTTGPVTPPGTAAPVSSTSKPKPGKTPRATAKTPVAKEPAAAAYAKSKSKSTAGGSGSRTTSTVPTIPNDASTKKPKSSSYYRTIAGVRYDRKVLEDCEASVGDDGVIDLDEAKQIVEDVLDGAVKVQKRGVLSAVTDVELATLRYAHQHFTWSKEADAWVYGKLLKEFEAGEDGGEGMDGDEEDDGSDDGVEDDDAGMHAANGNSSEVVSEEDSEDDSDDSSDDSSEDDSSSAKNPKNINWDALDEYNAFFFARLVDLAASKAKSLKADTAGTLFPSPAEREQFQKTERKAAARFSALDMFIVGEEKRGEKSLRSTLGKNKGGVKSSTTGTAQDSLFGGHQLGGDLIDVIPKFSENRGATIEALPDGKLFKSRQKPKQLLDEKIARRRGKDGNSERATRNDALKSAKLLATDGAGLFIKPLDSSKLHREAKKLGANQSAGKSWFSMPAVEYTPELRRDMRLLKLRGAYDPKRFYKTDDTSKLPKHFQVGTVVQGAQDFYSSRLTKKERKRTLTEEVFADAEIKKLRKKRFAKIQAAKAHTMGRSEKRKLGGRARNSGSGKPSSQKSTKRVKR